MSRVYFHSPSDTAELRGAERHHAGCMADEIALPCFGIDTDRFSGEETARRLCAMIEAPGRAFTPQHLPIAMRVDGSRMHFVLPDGRRAQVWETMLNTALAMGSPPVWFLTRMHAQCEIHAYVEGQDRAWLAGIIEQGRAFRVMRPEMGWEEVVELLRSRSDEPVVMSYSVCDQFPNRHVTDWTAPVDGPNGETWYDLPTEEKWRLGMIALRGAPMLRIQPADVGTYYFGAGINAFDVRAAIA
jgi:hypothetical protein